MSKELAEAVEALLDKDDDAYVVVRVSEYLTQHRADLVHTEVTGSGADLDEAFAKFKATSYSRTKAVSPYQDTDICQKVTVELRHYINGDLHDVVDSKHSIKQP